MPTVSMSYSAHKRSYREDEAEGLPPSNCYEGIETQPLREAPMKRRVVELGLFEGRTQRWISLIASTQEALQLSIVAARAKGWEVIPMYEGKEPNSGWPGVWMQKPAPNSNKAEVELGSRNDNVGVN